MRTHRFALFFWHSSNPVIAERFFCLHVSREDEDENSNGEDDDGEQKAQLSCLLTLIAVAVLIFPICGEPFVVLFHR